VPDRDWVKVGKTNNDDTMNKIFGKKDSSSSSEEAVDETKSVVTDAPGIATKAETEETEGDEKAATKEYVDEKFASIVGLLKAIRKDIAPVDADAPALDSENPKEEKTVTDDNEDDEPTTKTRKVTYRKTAETLLGLAKRLLKMEREGQEDSEGNGNLGEKEPVVETAALDQENPSTTKTRKAFRKVGLEVGTGTVDADEASDQHNPEETKTVEATKSNRQLAFELVKTAQMLIKGSTTETKLDDFETEKELVPGKTESGDEETDSNEFETAKTEEEEDSEKTSEGRFAMDDDESLVSTHDIPDSSEKKNSYGGEYDVSKKSVRKSISRGAPIDLLVAHLSKTLDTLIEKSKQDHHRILGLETQFMDSIWKNEELQKSIKELSAIPGPKKSVSMGIPYMFTKEGKRYPLVQVGHELGAQEVRKAAKGDFKSFWKENKSTMYDNTPGLDG